MDDKNGSKCEYLKAELWRQHLHWIDMMNRQVDENTATYLARFKEESRQVRGLVQEKLHEQQMASPLRVLFWITGK